MMFVEMSRDELHGGPGWGYCTCVWSPAAKENGTRWAYWSKILDVRKGDTIVHLRGVWPQAAFEGYSTAASDGYETSRRPPNPGQWGYSQHFYRADLRDFVKFERPVLLTNVFSLRAKELSDYFDKNKTSQSHRNLFYVRQAGRWQCQNGAYLSDLDEGLFTAVFGYDFVADEGRRPTFVSVRTGEQLCVVAGRLGQAKFSDQIRNLYGNACCFPSCPVTDSRFLIGSHIARWTDNKELRGDPRNGLCLCLMHDKAFEIGLFTVDAERRVAIRPDVRAAAVSLGFELAQAHGLPIKSGKASPMTEALKEHWRRIGYDRSKWK